MDQVIVDTALKIERAEAWNTENWWKINQDRVNTLIDLHSPALWLLHDCPPEIFLYTAASSVANRGRRFIDVNRLSKPRGLSDVVSALHRLSLRNNALYESLKTRLVSSRSFEEEINAAEFWIKTCPYRRSHHSFREAYAYDDSSVFAPLLGVRLFGNNYMQFPSSGDAILELRKDLLLAIDLCWHRFKHRADFILSLERL